MAEPVPASAKAWAEAMGDRLPDPATLPPSWTELADAVRDLVEATVATDVTDGERAAVTEMVGELVGRLRAERRDPVLLVGRHADGRLDNLTQAGSGTLNPQAPRITFGSLPPAPPDSEVPKSVEVSARCTPTAAHSGPPGKLHGGVVATILDEVIGRAATAAGASGLTAGIDVRFRAATPYDQTLVINARYTHSEGRKAFATGEILADGVITAEATAVFIAPRS